MALGNEDAIAPHLACGNVIVDYLTEELLINKQSLSLRSHVVDDLYSDGDRAWVIPLYTHKKAGGAASAVELLFEVDHPDQVTQTLRVDTTSMRIMGCHLYGLDGLMPTDRFSNYNLSAADERSRLLYRGPRAVNNGFPVGECPENYVRVTGISTSGFVPRERYIDFVTELRARFVSDAVFDAFAAGADELIRGGDVSDAVFNALAPTAATAATKPQFARDTCGAFDGDAADAFIPSPDAHEPSSHTLDLTPGAVVYLVGQPEILFTVGPNQTLYRAVSNGGDSTSQILLSTAGSIPDNRMFRNASPGSVTEKHSAFLTELAALEERLTTEIDAVRRDTQIAFDRVPPARPLNSVSCVEVHA